MEDKDKKGFQKISNLKVGKMKEITAEEFDIVESMLVNGTPLSDIAKYMGVTQESMLKAIKMKSQYFGRYLTAINGLVANSTSNLKKLANGFYYTERTYKSSINEHLVRKSKDRIIELLKQDKIKEALEVIFQSSIGENDIVVTEKYSAPDRVANTRLLEVFAPNLWDVESKRKQIPSKKIIVTVNGHKVTKPREVQSVDYVELAEDKNDKN